MLIRELIDAGIFWAITYTFLAIIAASKFRKHGYIEPISLLFTGKEELQPLRKTSAKLLGFFSIVYCSGMLAYHLDLRNSLIYWTSVFFVWMMIAYFIDKKMPLKKK